MSPRWRLILAAAALLGWLSYLGYAALTKSHGPMVSHIQAAAAAHAVVADVAVDAEGKPNPRVRVVEALSGAAPAVESVILVSNLTDANGFRGPGLYLLYLSDIGMLTVNGVPTPAFALVGQQRSPGNDLAGVGKPLIYAWNDDVRKQDAKLRR